jgi:RNA polymerase sigma factor (sigma-70 family)
MLSPPRADPAARQVRFEAVYAANHMSILGYALRRTASQDDAADILAETFLTAWRRLDELPSGDEARLWLYGVARRVLANFYRGERRRSALAERLRAELSYSYVPPELTGETARLADALRRLPEQDRELLTLAAWEGLDYGQIAVVFACSRNAVRIRLHRARQKLAKELNSYPERLPATPLPPPLPRPSVAGHSRPGHAARHVSAHPDKHRRG